MNDQKFFLCKHCGNLVGMINNAGVKIICCGEPMEELKPNTPDAAVEKHVPIVKRDGQTVEVCVGSVAPVSYTHLHFNHLSRQCLHMSSDYVFDYYITAGSCRCNH